MSNAHIGVLKKFLLMPYDLLRIILAQWMKNHKQGNEYNELRTSCAKDEQSKMKCGFESNYGDMLYPEGASGGTSLLLLPVLAAAPLSDRCQNKMMINARIIASGQTHQWSFF